MKDAKKILLHSSEPARRHFMQGIAMATLGVGLPSVDLPSIGLPGLHRQAEAATKTNKGTANAVIHITLSGGLSHLDTFDVKTRDEMSYGFKAIPTNVDGVMVSELLPRFAKVMDQVTLVRSMTSKTGAHGSGVYLMNTSYEKRGTVIHPNLGAWASKFRPSDNKSLPSFIRINKGESGRGFFESSHGALPILDPESGIAYAKKSKHVNHSIFNQRIEDLKILNARFSEKFKKDNVKSNVNSFEGALSLMKSKDLEAFDLNKEDKITREAFGKTTLGQGCLLARRLVEAGVRYIDVHSGGWDHHNDLPGRLPAQMADLDRVLASLITDLAKRNLLDRTLICVRTEFGRRPEIISSGGRGHNPLAFTTLMAGGGIKKGYVFGRTDELGNKVIDKPVTHADIAATVASAIGIDLKETYMSESGRPFQVANKGQSITDLFS